MAMEIYHVPKPLFINSLIHTTEHRVGSKWRVCKRRKHHIRMDPKIRHRRPDMGRKHSPWRPHWLNSCWTSRALLNGQHDSHHLLNTGHHNGKSHLRLRQRQCTRENKITKPESKLHTLRFSSSHNEFNGKNSITMGPTINKRTSGHKHKDGNSDIVLADGAMNHTVSHEYKRNSVFSDFLACLKVKGHWETFLVEVPSAPKSKSNIPLLLKMVRISKKVQR